MLVHHNDGKGKWQSHEVSHTFFENVPTGYGETYEEAYEEFKKHLGEYIQKAQSIYENLDNEVAQEIDCLGKAINKKVDKTYEGHPNPYFLYRKND